MDVTCVDVDQVLDPGSHFVVLLHAVKLFVVDVFFETLLLVYPVLLLLLNPLIQKLFCF